MRTIRARVRELVFCAAPFLGLWGCSGVCDANRVERAATDFAGPDATVCGDALCVLDAHESGEPAIFTGDPTQGIDSILSSWIVTNADEGLWFFSYDPLGSAAARHCVTPFEGDGAIRCGALEPQGNHYAVCGRSGGSPQPIPLDDR